ncbi:GH36-type glycosyl hydrolase domain-containing protein [Niabella insulamsoli]|uniref:GH36-type glycosyl hydrolase domain-containing protein n=1 Tax=Niabella insulamsoli TaxID=3144874 RepID=UPI0031FBC6F1
MKIVSPVDDFVTKLREYFTSDSNYPFKNEDPFRLDLLSNAQMKAHGERVAAQHEVLKTKQPDKVLKRLNENEEVIVRVQQMLSESIKEKQAIAPASEWFLDNFYLIKEQIDIARKHLPKGYSQTLPILAKGKSAGMPRVYDIALEIISHSDGRIDVANLTSFIEGYQTKNMLKIGELWAIPIMLRFAIIENIRRIVSRVAIDRLDKNEAIYWADEFIRVAQKNPKDVIIATAEMAKGDISLNSAFVAEFTRRMQGKGQGLAMPLSWIEQQLADTGHSVAELVNMHNQSQAADQVSMRNSIESIRLLKTTEWKKFVENVSVVEKVLREDITGTYPLMDFDTRDCYRHVVEWMGKLSGMEEHEIAMRAVALTKEEKASNAPERQWHVGYFLIDRGKDRLMKEVDASLRFKDRLRKVFKKNRFMVYAGSTFLFAFISGFLLARYVIATTGTWWLAVLTGLLAFIILGHFATIVINWIATLIVRPKSLPKLDFSKAVPDVYRTMIAVPCLLTSKAGIEELVSDLEVRYLSNPGDNLFYCLLSDFADAPQEHMPQDEALLALVKEEIEQLNIKYSQRGGGDKFFLLHRPRKWNKKEKVWMSYERKRGKLGELNSLLRNTGHDDFSLIVGDTTTLTNIKYVITLDADTILPRESAWKMIAAMAHPLNKPVIHPAKNRVVAGYGILQPRTAINLPGKDSSAYARMHSNDSGLDPYTQLVSDVYQDLFEEGSFIGKGIYDIDVFEKVLGKAFPENRILSHDLLEGSYVRSGLLTDVQLFEDYPETYWTDVSRRHRWIRGDWQIATWGLPFAPDAKNKLRRNDISNLSKWKIWDNIKRSLVSPAMLVLLILVWLFMPNPLQWIIGFLIFWFFMPVMSAVLQLIRRPKELSTTAHISDVLDGLKKNMAQLFYNIAVLPFEAFKNADAIFLANWRLLISRKRLLQWTPYAAQKGSAQKSVAAAYSYMWLSTLSVIALGICIVMFQPSALGTALPFLVLWLAAPIIAWGVSRKRTGGQFSLSSSEAVFLQVANRKIWAFFEDFVTAEDHFLPPDNYQEKPVEATAHRTSPTNIGLSCLVNLSAFDFGYISLCRLVERTQNTFRSLSDMERYRGHFYNWYETTTLQPLYPKYISAVDSGNFVANMIVLRQGLLELPHQPVFNSRFYEGLLHTWQTLESLGDQKNTLADLQSSLSHPPQPTANLLEHKKQLESLRQKLIAVKQAGSVGDNADALYWLEKMERQLEDAFSSFSILTPWVDLLPVPPSYDALKSLEEVPVLQEIHPMITGLLPIIDNLISGEADPLQKSWLERLKTVLKDANAQALEKLSKIEKLANECSGFADVAYDFLYDASKHLFHIGYNVSEDIKDKSYYDILASEARLGIYTAIAQGKVPQDSWFALGRLITNEGTAPVLLSWSGSMFEYLMPDLVMPSYENTLLEKTAQGVIQNQIDYARRKNIPWGISESGYNLVDAQLNYQYQAFGVPGLGLKRGLGQDLVIAPYATALGLMVDPGASINNLQKQAALGFEGKYGFYEAIDYTQSRMPRGKSFEVIRSFMAHHQGMSFLSIARLLLGEKMQHRFERDPQLQSALLLLKERSPKATNYYTQDDNAASKVVTSHESHIRIINTPHTPVPEVQLLSNGRYHVAITNGGGSYSKWKHLAVTRWREDVTQDNWGTFCYIKDLSTGDLVSNTYQPTQKKFNVDETIFSQGHVEFRRVNNDFEIKTDIVVSPEDDISIRKIKVTNKSSVLKELEVTGYTEVVIAPQAADEAHPAFSNLFVQTKISEKDKAIVCTRRARSRDEQPPWMFFMMQLSGVPQEVVSFESDRMRFIGRTQSLQAPAGAAIEGPLSGTDGSVLDPVAAIKYKITLKPRQTATFEVIVGMSENKETCGHLIEKYHDSHLKNRAFELSWTHSQVLLRQINASESEAQLFNAMAGHILYANATHRADANIIASNRKGQSGLWGYSISGDLPIVLVRVQDSEDTTLVRQLIKAHSYWRMKGLAVDLIIWNDDFGTYRQLLHDQIMGFVTAISGAIVDQPGGIFVKQGDQLSTEDRVLFQTVARLIFFDHAGSLQEQMTRQKAPKQLPPVLKVTGRNTFETGVVSGLPDNLVFNNGTGGFTPDGKEYFILTTNENKSPAPWVNIIANSEFGTMVSESGPGYSWAENAHAYRLSPWKNDPVSDKTGEAFYIRDDISGRYWSPSPLPRSSGKPYITRNGFGYTVYEHIAYGIKSEMWVFVDVDDAIKFTLVRIKNITEKPRKLSVTGYVEWVLGDTATNTRMHVVTEKDLETGTLFARNHYNSIFSERVSFLEAEGAVKSYTCDRTEFLGRNGSLAAPAGMTRERLSNRYGAALDPCTAIQIGVELMPDEEKEVIFRLGSARNEHDARELIKKFRNEQTVHEAQSKVHDQWNHILGNVYVNTPDHAFNVLANGWLVYQALACRVWGRSGFYQSGGAFGFRDQLQDVLALMHTRPDITRAQILLAASRQFKEGDVQHWWHPPTGRGVRTTCSDDYLWLPFVTARYLETTGDTGVLEEYVSFIQGRPLRPDEESYYDLPVFLNEWETVYNHCKRAINFGLKFGHHGLPLIGSGDWNDGMDKVGEHGKGESVWLGFFLYDVLIKFASIAEQQKDEAFHQKCISEAERLKSNINENAWDGEWYRRAYFDDGTPLGSSQNEECRIDSISQSWSVISGAGAPGRTEKAMASLNEHLIDRENGIIKLLTPAFDKSDLYPGYIKGYVPGVRENGGQYTHAAIWTMMAFAMIKDKERVWELFSMVNPVNHAVTKDETQKYKVEPYVMAADVYGVAPHEGRGGWTWYTGSAGWTYQLALEHILGLKRKGDELHIDPCIPDDWPGFEVNYKFGNTLYQLHVRNEKRDGSKSIVIDENATADDFIRLADDGQVHRVTVLL